MKRDQLRQAVAEIAESITNSKVAKIHQPAADLVILRLWNGQQNVKLLISVSAVGSCLQLTDQDIANPFTPPRFCQLLRARVSRINSISQVNDDRIVQIDASGRSGQCRLMVELIDHRANLILIDEAGQIIDSLRRTEKGEGARDLRAGATYQLPHKSIHLDEKFTGSKAKPIENSSQSVEKLYTQPEVLGETNDLKAEIGKLIKREQRRFCRRLKNIEKERERQKDFDTYRRQGELILANFHRIHKGMASVSVDNYYLDPPQKAELSLDPRLSPQGNAERYFKMSQKARRGLDHSARRCAETLSELEWLEQLSYQLESAETADQVLATAEELRAAGGGKNRVAERYVRPGKRKSSFAEALSPSGFTVVWGKTSRQNDQLSTKLLKKGDLWFHAHRCPGAHVVLQGAAGAVDFTDEDISFAASIAAGYSKANQDSKVEVMIVEPKALRKPKGAKPGMVSVQNHKIIVVQPFRPDTV